MKVCQRCGEEIATRDGENTCPGGCKLKKEKRSRSRRERDQAMEALGMTKVRGAMGGVYWE